MLLPFFFTTHAQSNKSPETGEAQEGAGMLSSSQRKEEKSQRQPLAEELPSFFTEEKKSKDINQPSNKTSQNRARVIAKDFLYFNDFMDDPPGAVPEGWFANDSCKLVVLKNWPGHWLSLARKGSYAPGDSFVLPETFTLEFDVLMESPPEEGLGTFSVSLAAIEEENPTEAWRYLFTTTDLYVGWNYSTFTVEQAGRREKHHVENNILRQELGRPVHIVLVVKEGRYTLFVNEQKVVDIPDLMEAGHRYNRLLLSSQLSKADERHQVLISNLKLRSGQTKRLPISRKTRTGRH